MSQENSPSRALIGRLDLLQTHLLTDNSIKLIFICRRNMVYYIEAQMDRG